MSASLVGSEMCIRDRPCALNWQSRPCVCCRALLPRVAQASMPPRASARCCLLYTSDAADDM
eukprot:11193730-Alexandrium_andersonii.AAC.1